MCAFWPFQVTHGFFVGQSFAGKQAVVHHDNAVARHESYFLGRASLDHAVYVYGIFLYGKLDTDAAETAFQFGVHFFQLLCRDIGGVGVKFCQYLRHCFFYEVGHVDAVHILIVHHP